MFTVQFRSREDAGLLYAEQLVGPFAAAREAQDLILSQSTTLGNWTLQVSNNEMQIDELFHTFPVWEYPIEMPNGRRIAVSGPLAEGAMGRGPNASTVHLE